MGLPELSESSQRPAWGLDHEERGNKKVVGEDGRDHHIFIKMNSSVQFAMLWLWRVNPDRAYRPRGIRGEQMIGTV